jgi:hypothetical protein
MLALQPSRVKGQERAKITRQKKLKNDIKKGPSKITKRARQIENDQMAITLKTGTLARHL